MEFIILTSGQKEQLAPQLWEMMQASDREFIPPLSSRSSTTQADLTGKNTVEDGLQLYFSQMMQQQILAAMEGERLLSYVSYRENYICPEIGEDTHPNIYLSTLISRPETRGKGLTKQLYDHLFNTCYPDRSIFTRTWSTNAAHIRIFDKFGFSLLCRKENDRGPGLDTVYFSLKR